MSAEGKKSVFQGRTFARRVAFQVIYEKNMNEEARETLDQEFIDEQFDILRRVALPDEDINENKEDCPDIALPSEEILKLSRFTKKLIELTFLYREEIDARIEKASEKWRLDRMSATDLSILRMAAAEIFYLKTPEAVVINEAIELGKKFGSGDSSAFINGVLGKIVRDKKEE